MSYYQVSELYKLLIMSRVIFVMLSFNRILLNKLWFLYLHNNDDFLIYSIPATVNKPLIYTVILQTAAKRVCTNYSTKTIFHLTAVKRLIEFGSLKTLYQKIRLIWR